MMGKDKVKDKEQYDGETAATSETSPVPGMPVELPTSPPETSAETAKHGMLP